MIAGPFDLAGLGFFVCVADLEDELIRSLGAGRVEQLIAAEGELIPFQTFVKQPAHRGEPRERVPGPLAGLLAWM